MSSFTDKYLRVEGIKKAYADPEKRRKFWIAAAILLAIILIYPKVQPLLSDINLFTEEIEDEPVQVDAIVAETERLDNKISATGTLRAIQEVDLSAETAGMVIGLYIREGAEVERGELLVKVNDNDLQAERMRLESNIEVVEETEARQRQLFERGGATQEDYDQTRMELNNLKAEKTAIEAQIERTEVRAPFNGIVGLTYISDGSYVTSSTRIATLQDMSSMRIDFSIPERYSASVTQGSEVRFEIQGSDSIFVGEVVASEPQIDPRTRTLQVRAVIENEDRVLNPGSFANVELILSTFDEAIMIPSVSLIPDSGDYKVLIYRDGTVHEQFVETGIRTRNHVQILNGISPGDTLLTSGLMQVSEGSRVEIRSNEE